MSPRQKGPLGLIMSTEQKFLFPVIVSFTTKILHIRCPKSLTNRTFPFPHPFLLVLRHGVVGIANSRMSYPSRISGYESIRREEYIFPTGRGPSHDFLHSGKWKIHDDLQRYGR